MYSCLVELPGCHHRAVVPGEKWREKKLTLFMTDFYLTTFNKSSEKLVKGMQTSSMHSGCVRK